MAATRDGKRMVSLERRLDPMMAQSDRIFISYARSDGRDLAFWLQQQLAARGFEAWMDRSLQPGENWSSEIERQLDQSQVVLALLSRGSLDSRVCRGEHLWALDRSKRVIPVLVQRDAPRPVYLYADQFIDFSDSAIRESGFTNFLRSLETAPSAIRNVRYDELYNTVPELPPNYVARPDVLERLREAILRERGSQVVALHAMGGFGKTVLASAICRDPIVQAAFPDGVVWATIGQDPKRVLPAMREIGKALGGDPNRFEDVDPAKNQLRTTLRERSALIVLDDVWRKSDADMFLVEAPRCCFLLTTREYSVVSELNAEEIALREFKQPEAESLLAAWAKLSRAELPPEAAAIIAECNALPLAISVIGASLRNKPADRWADKLQRLRASDLGHFPQVLKSIEVSVEAIEDSTVRERYLDFAVFAGKTLIPETVLSVFWNMDMGDVRNIVDNLCDRSLLQRDRQGLRLHDLHLDYVRFKIGKSNLPQLHDRLLRAYDNRQDDYLFRHRAWHLVGAERKQELQTLLLSSKWLASKLAATDVNSIASDYEYCADVEPFQLISEAIRLSSHVLAVDKTQLHTQLAARLHDVQTPEIRTLLQSLSETAPQFWLQPIRSGLTAAGGPLVRTLPGHRASVKAIVILGDGQHSVSGGADGSLHVWDLDSGTLVKTLQPHEGDIESLSIVPGSARILSSSTAGTVRLWDMESGQVLRQFDGPGNRVKAVTIPPDNRRAFVAADGKGFVYDLERGEEILSVTGCTAVVAVTPDGKSALTGASNSQESSGLPLLEAPVTVALWDLSSGARLGSHQGYQGYISGIAVTPNGRRVLVASYSDKLRLWDFTSGQLIYDFQVPTNFATMREGLVITSNEYWNLILCIAVSPDGRHAAAGYFDKKLRVWDLESGDLLATMEGHIGTVTAVAISPKDRRRILSGSDDGSLKLWQLRAGKDQAPQRPHSRAVSCLAPSPDGNTVISGSKDGFLQVWDVESGDIIRTLEGHDSLIDAVVISPDGAAIVSGSRDGVLNIWNLESGALVRGLHAHDGWILSLAVTQDGDRIISSSADESVKVWGFGSGELLLTLSGAGKNPRSLAVINDGEHVACASDGILQVWRLDDGTLVRNVDMENVFAIKATNNHPTFLSRQDDGSWQMHDADSNGLIQRFSGHSSLVTAVDLSTKSARALSGANDGTLKLWETASARILASFTADAPITACTFSAADEVVVAGDEEGQVHVLRIRGDAAARTL